jgi:hypothetical protein
VLVLCWFCIGFVLVPVLVPVLGPVLVPVLGPVSVLSTMMPSEGVERHLKVSRE